MTEDFACLHAQSPFRLELFAIKRDNLGNYFATLASVDAFKVSEAELTLSSKGNVVARFRSDE